MIITISIDHREMNLFELCNEYINKHNFKNIVLESKNLPIGDIVLSCDEKELIIIERKTIQDLAASIKDGRYSEQSYRLSHYNIHNHNIIYLIEGDWNQYNNKFNKSIDQHTLISSIISINYYKGFSVHRTFNISETAMYIVYFADKLQRENTKRTSFYSNKEDDNNIEIDAHAKDLKLNDIKNTAQHYCEVVKKVKKDNITIDNIGEILLSQIPNVSTQSAIAVMKKFKTIKNLIYHLQQDDKCLDDIFTGMNADKCRKLNKNCKLSIYKYLLQINNEIVIK